ncbi:MAG TPA: carbon starvation protein A [Synergistales bacterium]|nr:carbon starvation protein A [Synergistales bacterium]HRV70419.1 carbon starvation protein A [Thermovirgaceae bacterium]
MLAMLFIFASVFFVGAYFTYGNFQAKLYGLSNDNKPPSEVYFDGVDYVPAHPSVLLGHHFASIAGAGPIVGPITAAALFGWLPTYIWCLVGSVFFGGVHDMGALVSSMRHKGLSVGEVVDKWIGRRGKMLFLTFTWLALVLVVAVFLQLSANTFAADPAVAFSGTLYIFLAVVFGVLIYKKGIPLGVTTLVMVPIVIGAVFYGSSAEWVQTSFNYDVNTWRLILTAYVFLASVLPVWLLLQPRDYLASFMLYFSVLLGAIGMIFGTKFSTDLPAFKGFYAGGTNYLWPMLFVIVACGAISGFHALVGSGTTSKQLKSEKDAQLVGYGSMLIEGLVAVIAIGTVMVAGGIMEGGPTVTYGHGIGQFAGLIGIDIKVGTSLGLLALNSFLLTSLDTATRLARYQLQEFTGMKLNKYVATAISVFGALFLLYYKTGGKAAWALIWPVFGASNQLVAALTLLALAVWVKNGLKKDNRFAMYPFFFMLATTMAALFFLIKTNLNNLLLSGISVVLVVLAVMLVMEAKKALSGNGPKPQE